MGDRVEWEAGRMLCGGGRRAARPMRGWRGDFCVRCGAGCVDYAADWVAWGGGDSDDVGLFGGVAEGFAVAEFGGGIGGVPVGGEFPWGCWACGEGRDRVAVVSGGIHGGVHRD